MKDKILSYARSKQNSNDRDLKKFAKLLIRNINDFNCYYCLDTGKNWNERGTGAFIDMRGSYDIRKCNHCSNGGWVECTNTTNHKSPSGIKIFHKNTVTENDIIDQLKIFYKDKLAEEPEWYLYQKDTIDRKTKETDININVNDLAIAVSASLKIYAGNLIGVIQELKDLTINMSFTLSEDNDSKEVIKRYDQDDRTYYLLFKLSRKIKERSAIGNFFKSRKFTFTAKYLILSPKNNCAQEICNDLMNDNIQDKIDHFTL